MTHKEKAKELLDRFAEYASLYSSFDVDKFCVMNDAKHCALIAVDEILHFMDLFNLDLDMKHQHKWWQQVKKEIEKL